MRTLRWLVPGAFAYAFVLSQGIPLWDDDFASLFWKIKDTSIWEHVLAWVSPLSAQTENWAFNERPVQRVIYLFFQMISGYESWSYFLFKDLCIAGLAAMAYLWGLRLVPNTREGRLAALGGALLLLLAPGTAAAHVIHSDLAPLAELLFLALTYVIWGELEKTPVDWKGLPKLSKPEHRSWLRRWSVISVCTFLAYKSKADTKLIPGILAAYVVLVPERRKQWAFFAVPLGLMVLLAVPWGPGLFSKVPPFLPGSRGSEIGWMWQPASASRLLDFFWSSEPYSPLTHLWAPTLSLAGLLGPFLLVPLLGLLARASGGLDEVPWLRRDRPVDRARIFVLVWALVVFVGVSALPGINYTFRIRYGILTMVPVSLLVAWALGALSARRKELPRWGLAAAAAALALQCAVNLTRSMVYRRDLGVVMVSVDQAYEYMETHFRSEKLALLPDFLSYDYRPGSGPWFLGKERVSGTDELGRRFTPDKTYVLSWSPSLWERLELVKRFDGCSPGVLFDRLFPCSSGVGAHLMRLIPPDLDYAAGEKLRAEKNFAAASVRHGAFLDRYPGSLLGRFLLGLDLIELKRWDQADALYADLEGYFPSHRAIVYNRAIIRMGMNDHVGAARRLRALNTAEPGNYGVMMNLYVAYDQSGDASDAKTVLRSLHDVFPADPEVQRLIAAGKHL